MSFNEKLQSILKTDSRFVDQDGDLLKSEVIDKAWKIDHKLIELLLDDTQIKAKFFDEIKGHWVFNINTFIDYVQDKNFYASPYTKFRNKIGLTINGKYLKERGEVALVWPYKDCVLEGGQSKEEEKRKEIFFNEVLAQDEIDRLLDPKVLTGFKRYTVKGEEPVTEFKRDKDGKIRENLIIKGNNLLALHSLKEQFRAKVKLIYIDPPYNTGKDSFGYNDSFNHSTWMTFFKNRLQIAKDILQLHGVIFIQLDDHEVSYAKLVCDEIFGRENFCNDIVVLTNNPFGYKSTSSSLFKQAGHILFYAKNKENLDLSKVFIPTEYDDAYHFIFDDITISREKWTWKNLHDIVAQNLGYTNKKDAIKKLGNENYINKVLEYAIKNADRVFRTASVTGGAYLKRRETINKSAKDKSRIYIHPNDDMDYLFIGGERVIFYNERIIEFDNILMPGVLITDLWTDIPLEGISKEGGVKFNRGKKPEKLIQRIIDLIIRDKSEIVMDFHIGSGTTGAVAHKNGLQYIGIEQLDYGKNDSIHRLKNVVNGDQSGISKSVKWTGGGDFIYCELMKYNEDFIERIQDAEITEKLLDIWEDMKARSFLNYNVDIQKMDERIEEFKGLSLIKQKETLLDILNKNQLYMNLSEIEDQDFEVSEDDKTLNRLFYGE